MQEIIIKLMPAFSAIVSITGMSVMFGFVLTLAKMKLSVEKDPRIQNILDSLPGSNCGACGLPGCSAYASLIVQQKYKIDLCTVGGKETAQKIAQIMGVEHSGVSVSLKARVRCRGGNEETVNRFIYDGPVTCLAAQGVMAGPKQCEFGCLGYGDCAKACPFDALAMNQNGLPAVDFAKCTGCGLCVKACPRSIILLAPEGIGLHVMCMNTERAPVMKKGCSVGCTGCKLCERACKEVFAEKPEIGTAVSVVDFLAGIDYSKCINCFKCAEVCPVPVIHPLEKSKKIRPGTATERREEAAV